MGVLAEEDAATSGASQFEQTALPAAMVAGRRLSGWKPDAVVDFNDENDDEAERAKLAELKREESEKRQQRSPYRGTPGGEKRRTALLDTYAECIKMCTENVRAATPPVRAFGSPPSPH